MKAALQLQDYQEYIPGEEIYSQIALSSYSNECYDICSKAFIKLEALGSQQNWTAFTDWQTDGGGDSSGEVPEERRVQYEELAVRVFSSNPPNGKGGNVAKVDCKFCGEVIADYSTSCSKCHTKFAACVASGKPISDPKQQWVCKQCRHYAIREEVNSYTNCPLCHFKIN